MNFGSLHTKRDRFSVYFRKAYCSSRCKTGQRENYLKVFWRSLPKKMCWAKEVPFCWVRFGDLLESVTIRRFYRKNVSLGFFLNPTVIHKEAFWLNYSCLLPWHPPPCPNSISLGFYFSFPTRIGCFPNEVFHCCRYHFQELEYHSKGWLEIFKMSTVAWMKTVAESLCEGGNFSQKQLFQGPGRPVVHLNYFSVSICCKCSCINERLHFSTF